MCFMPGADDLMYAAGSLSGGRRVSESMPTRASSAGFPTSTALGKFCTAGFDAGCVDGAADEIGPDIATAAGARRTFDATTVAPAATATIPMHPSAAALACTQNVRFATALARRFALLLTCSATGSALISAISAGGADNSTA